MNVPNGKKGNPPYLSAFELERSQHRGTSMKIRASRSECRLLIKASRTTIDKRRSAQSSLPIASTIQYQITFYGPIFSVMQNSFSSHSYARSTWKRPQFRYFPTDSERCEDYPGQGDFISYLYAWEHVNVLFISSSHLYWAKEVEMALVYHLTQSRPSSLRLIALIPSYTCTMQFLPFRVINLHVYNKLHVTFSVKDHKRDSIIKEYRP